MKKLLSLLLTMAVSISLIPQVVVAEDINTADEKEYKIINELGLLPEGVEEKIETGENITRGEFAAVLYNMYNFQSKNAGMGKDEPWKDEFFGNYSMTETVTPKSVNTNYTDVDSGTEFFEEINIITSLGFLNPDNNEFKPDEEIIYVDCLEQMLKLMGAGRYINAEGGYPDGVMEYGSTRDIFSKNRADKMSVSDVCKLIYTSLDENVIKCEVVNGVIKYYETDVQLMEKYLKLKKVTGIMTDNDIVSLNGEDVGKNMVVIDGYTFDTAVDCSELLGLNVKAYVSTDKNTENTIYAIEIGNRNVVTEIDAKDIIEYRDYKISYYKGSNEKTLKLKEKTFLIYNGKAKKSWLAEDFDIEDGKITVIENGTDYNVVIIESYKSIFVSGYDSDNYVIYNKAQDAILNNGDESFSLEKAIDAEKLFITDTMGNKLGVESIATGKLIDIIINDDYAKLVLPDSVQSGFLVKSVNNSNDIYKHYFTISDGENTYYVKNSYLNTANGIKIEKDKTYTLYFNRDGVVSWLSSELVNDKTVAYFIRGYMDEDEAFYIKVLNENGVVVRIKTEDKVTYIDEKGNRDKPTDNVVKNRLNDYEGIISYKTNNVGEVKLIEIPRTDDTKDEALKVLYDTGDGTIQCKNTGTLTSFENKFFASNNTSVFVVPEKEEDKGIDSNYMVDVRTNLFFTDRSYQLKSYTMDKNNRVAQYLVYKKDASAEFKYNTESLVFVLVEDVYMTLNSDDEVCKAIKGKQFGYGISIKDVTYYAKYDETDSKGNTVSALDIAIDMPQTKNAKGESNTYEIQKGDIIRVIVGIDDITLEKAQLVYGIKRENPEFSEGRKGWFAGTRSNLLNGTDKYTNPMAMNYNNATLNTATSWTGGCKVLCGFVYEFLGGVMEITTKDLSVNSYYDNESLAYMTEWRTYQANTLITVNDDKYTVGTGSESGIRTYKNEGARCSRIIICSIDMHERCMIVIND